MSVGLWMGGIAAVLLIGAELVLRWVWGFGQPLLYVADPEIGYLLAPNQTTRRFGHQIAINHYSMRSPQVTADRPPQTLRILLLGDSIANGGWWTDQTETISAQLQQQLQRQLQRQLETAIVDPDATSNLPSDLTQGLTQGLTLVEVLNASANSWGPRNELAYLQRFGHFGSQAVVLLINTDDLFATAPISLYVGQDRNYPDRKPPLALTEVIQRYLLKSAPSAELQAAQQEGGDRVGRNLAAIDQIQTMTTQANSQLLLVITPLKRELGTPGPRDYEQQARQRLQEFAQTQRIPLIDFLPIFNASPDAEMLYQDHIHLNIKGNEQVVNRVLEKLEELRPSLVRLAS